jgi:hypothetical protein
MHREACQNPIDQQGVDGGDRDDRNVATGRVRGAVEIRRAQSPLSMQSLYRPLM